MKRILKGLFLFVLLLQNAMIFVRADVGPKPSVTIYIDEAPNNQKYYVTLLSEVDQYGPWNHIEVGTNNEADAFFVNYQDKEGFYYLGNAHECSESHTYSWSYYPPNPFKVAIYCPETNYVGVSEITTREAFDGYYHVTYGSNPLIIKEEVKLDKKILSFALRVVLTLIVEILLGLLFGYRKKKEVLTILITNIITQILLNLGLSVVDYYGGWLVWFVLFILGEFVVFLIEAIVYCIVFKDHSRWKTIAYALLANILTFILGIYTSAISI